MWYYKLLCVFYVIVQVTSEDVTGLNMTNRRIYLGSRASITDAPFMAVIMMAKSTHTVRCGASIIQPQLLVSAAHCLIRGLFYVRVGSDILHGGERYEIERWFLHPNYVYHAPTDIYYNDVSVVKLIIPLRYSERVRPIALGPPHSMFAPGTLMETFGFGANERGRESPYLLRATVPYIDSRVCSNTLKLQVTPSMMCVVGAACFGDSGGPLVYNNLLVGVVSFGRGCGGHLPAVYARIAVLRHFIDNIISVHG